MRYVCIFFTSTFVTMGFFKLVEMVCGDLSNLPPIGLAITCVVAVLVAALLQVGRGVNR